MVQVRWATFTESLGDALRCDISNVTAAPLTAVQVVSYTLVSGAEFLVSDSDPMNMGTCGGSGSLISSSFNPSPTTTNSSSLLSGVSNVNLTCVVPHPRAISILATLSAVPTSAYTAVSAILAANPSLLSIGATSRSWLSAVVPSQMGPAAPTSSISATASKTPSPHSAGTSGLSQQGAAIIGGTISAVAVLVCCSLLAFICVRKRREKRGFTSVTATRLDGVPATRFTLDSDGPPALRVQWTYVGYRKSTPVTVALMNLRIAPGPLVQSQVGQYHVTDSESAILMLPSTLGAHITASNCAEFSVVVSVPESYSGGARCSIETPRFTIPPGAAPAVPKGNEYWRAYKSPLVSDLP